MVNRLKEFEKFDQKVKENCKKYVEKHLNNSMFENVSYNFYSDGTKTVTIWYLNLLWGYSECVEVFYVDGEIRSSSCQ